MTSVSVLDLGLAVFVLLFLVRGLLRGMIREVAGFVAIFLGIFVAGRFYPLLSTQLLTVFSNPKWANTLAYAAVFMAVLVLVALAAAVLQRFMTLTFTAWVDTLLGAVVGCAKGVLICAIVLALLQRFAADSPFLKDAVLPQYIDWLISFAKSLFPDFIKSAVQHVPSLPPASGI